MSEPTRWTIFGLSSVQAPDGEWVRYEQVATLTAQLAEARGVIAADDERLRAAEARVFGSVTYGCDAPDHLAEEVLSVRAQLAEARDKASGGMLRFLDDAWRAGQRGEDRPDDDGSLQATWWRRGREHAAAQAEVTALREALASVEWAGAGKNCPVCHRLPVSVLGPVNGGHASDCKLAALLGGQPPTGGQP